MKKEDLEIGGKYKWKHQPERLVYLGMHGCWHQFTLAENLTKVWCELLEPDLQHIEAAEERAEAETWMPKVGSEYRHYKGAVYVVDEITNLATTEPVKFQVMVNYTRTDDGTKWSRPLEDWMKKFSPHQKGSEKQKDEQIEMIENALGNGRAYTNQAFDLYEEGVRVLQDGEILVKELPADIKRSLTTHIGNAVGIAYDDAIYVVNKVIEEIKANQ